MVSPEILNLHESAGNQFQYPCPVVGNVKRNIGRCYISSVGKFLEDGPCDYPKMY